MRSKTRVTSGERRESAERIALAALSFLAAEPQRLGGFLAATGLGPENLRTAARDSAFFVGVLDYLLADEPMLLTFAAEQGIEPKTVSAARQVLAPEAGGD